MTTFNAEFHVEKRMQIYFCRGPNALVFVSFADLIYKEVVDYESREHNAVGNAMHNHNPSKYRHKVVRVFCTMNTCNSKPSRCISIGRASVLSYAVR